MLRSWSVAMQLIVLVGFTSGAVLPCGAEAPPLIPREVLFGNPKIDTPRISPDGTRISYRAPSADGVMNVWVRTIGEHDDRMVTHDTGSGIRNHRSFWAYDNRHLIYQQDSGGNEIWHVYSTDLEAGVVRDLTPFQGICAEDVMLSKHRPKELLIGMNLRDRRVFDMYRVDLTTGAVNVDTENPGNVRGWGADRDFRIRIATAYDQASGATILRARDTPAAPWKDLIVWPPGEEGRFIDFTADGKSVLVETTLGSDTTRLALVDVSTGKETRTIASDPRCDVDDVVLAPETGEVQAVAFNPDRALGT